MCAPTGPHAIPSDGRCDAVLASVGLATVPYVDRDTNPPATDPATTAAAVPAPSPLAAIEAAVQARAKAIDLDLAAPEGHATLRALIDDEIDRWNDDTRRGRHPHDVADTDTVARRAWHNLTTYGPLTTLLDDPDVWEIMINSPADIFVKRHHGPDGYHHDTFHDDDHVTRTLTKILDDATGSHRTLDPTQGLQDAQLDDGSRLHIAHPDLARGGHTIVNIRKFAATPFHTLSQLVDVGTLDAATAAFLAAAVRARLSIVFAGPPGSGKTTLLSCCAAHLDPTWRAVVAEEVFETDIPIPNLASLQTRPPRPDRPPIHLRHLVGAFLRMAPDIAVVGEVRDREAMPLLMTLSSGVKGFTTIHAGSARQALTRLRLLAQLDEAAATLPMGALNALVSESVDLVVHSRRAAAGPQVTEVIAVEDLAAGVEATHLTATDVFTRQPDGRLAWTGLVPVRAARAFTDAGIDVAALLAAGGRAPRAVA
jgi:pilus assembly protein CpaF